MLFTLLVAISEEASCKNVCSTFMSQSDNSLNETEIDSTFEYLEDLKESFKGKNLAEIT